MKTILVIARGIEADEAVFETAYGAAAPLAAHLEFLHVRLSATEAACFAPHMSFARGKAVRNALHRLQEDAQMRSVASARRFRQFCRKHNIEEIGMPSCRSGVTAEWREELDGVAERITLHGRHNDLVVVGRASDADGMPQDLNERILFGCGRPLLIAPAHAPRHLAGTALICWKETAESVRSLAAALPLLTKCKSVFIASVEEDSSALSPNYVDIARHLAWHGIAAEIARMPVDARPVSRQLEDAADRYEADLVVMGAYGHSRAREQFLGGCTQHFLERADRPVFLMH